jgi:hypothetical protein
LPFDSTAGTLYGRPLVSEAVFIYPDQGMRRVLRSFFTAVLVGLVGIGVTWAEPARPPVPEDEIVSRYLDATQEQQTALRGGSMEVDIDARLPKRKMHGTLHALRNISKLGRITYHMLGFSGDNTVKTEVIARYLSAEVQANQGESNLSISPANYKFRYKGTQELDGRDAYVLRVTPKEKKVGLFKGELWLDTETFMPVRESGSFVKTPSIFLKKVQFVRHYMIQNGVSVPQRTESKIEARFFGPVELDINYLNFSKEAEADDAATGTLNDRK